MAHVAERCTTLERYRKDCHLHGATVPPSRQARDIQLWAQNRRIELQPTRQTAYAQGSTVAVPTTQYEQYVGNDRDRKEPDVGQSVLALRTLPKRSEAEGHRLRHCICRHSYARPTVKRERK
jgi:hypothetical protein